MITITKKVVDAAFSERGKELRKIVSKIREDSINNLKDYISSFVENIEANGGKVYIAKTADDARNILKKIVDGNVIKSKTNVGKEIGIQDVVKAVETDTGDFIASLLGDSGHPILPAINKTPEEISKMLEEKYKISVPPTPEKIVSAIRDILRKKILSANIGITGANVITADGEIFIMENEGNISLTSHLPQVHIVITSIEKIVKDAISAMYVCKALSYFGTKQKSATYVNVISGPSSTADVGGVLVSPAQGPKELYVILVDNGRSKLFNSPYRDILKCINCGACISVCPLFNAMGKEYGFEQKGSRGIILQRYQKSESKLFDKAFYCTGCGLCKEVCPVGIDLPNLIRTLRNELQQKGLQTEKNLQMIKNVLTRGDTIGSQKMDSNIEFYCC